MKSLNNQGSLQGLRYGFPLGPRPWPCGRSAEPSATNRLDLELRVQAEPRTRRPGGGRWRASFASRLRKSAYNYLPARAPGHISVNVARAENICSSWRVFLRLTLCRHATSEGLKKRRFGLTCLRFFDTSQSVIVSLASAILFGITARPSHEELSAASKPNDDEADGN
jgi:hypothetical protein